MPIGKGTYGIGPDTGGVLTMHTGRDGFGAMIGHDLVLEATRWQGTVVVDPDEPGGSLVEATVDAGSLEVVRGEGGIKPLTDRDRSDIQRTIREQVLRTATHPDIVFRSTGTAGTDRSLSVRGELTVAGRTCPVTLVVSVHEEAGATVATATTTILQTAFGIKPYSAFMGALRVRDSVEVRIEATLCDEE
jgi:polyisoprenoid-binding protein YceI